jgi:hypothetical protein
MLLVFGVIGIVSRRFGGKHGTGVTTGDLAVLFGIGTTLVGLYFCYVLLSARAKPSESPPDNREKPKNVG